MISIQKQIAYWTNSAEEDWEVAQELVNNGRVRHGLFFAHLALEKMLKAHVCRYTQDLAPKIHDLVRLAKLAEIPSESLWRDFFEEMGIFNIEGRYPELLGPLPTKDEARKYLHRTGETLEWLKNLLSNS
jgi:HEPN domain-containing protein